MTVSLFAGTAGAAGAQKVGTCPKVPFTGTISRTKDSFSNQPAAKRAGASMVDAIVYDFGTRVSYTVYVGDYTLDPVELGSTLVAPTGKVLVTIFLATKNGKPLRRGQRLTVGRDLVTVIVDASGEAKAATTDPKGSARILKVTKRRVCFTIDYQDRYQRVKGSVSAPIPVGRPAPIRPRRAPARRRPALLRRSR
jgi:hypothetical protein